MAAMSRETLPRAAVAQLRAMTSDDLDAVVEVARASFSDLTQRLHLPVMESAEPTGLARRRALRAHLLSTDPGRQLVAVDDQGGVIGAASALLREGIWGLSLLTMLPGVQSRGTGRLLLDTVLQTAQEAEGALICSSVDARAMRRYALAGFRAAPSLTARGRVRREALAAARGVRVGGHDDLPLTAAVDRRVRGGAREVDHAFGLESGATLRVADGSGTPGTGYVLHTDTRVSVLAADDPSTAASLLRAALAAMSNEEVEVDWLTEAQYWAVEVVLQAGLSLSPAGPVFARGAVGPLHPYLIHGALL